MPIDMEARKSPLQEYFMISGVGVTLTWEVYTTVPSQLILSEQLVQEVLVQSQVSLHPPPPWLQILPRTGKTFRQIPRRFSTFPKATPHLSLH